MSVILILYKLVVYTELQRCGMVTTHLSNKSVFHTKNNKLLCKM